VDDEPAVCRAFARLLRAARFDVETFDSGDAFLASLATRRPGCVVLDLHLPGKSGFDVQSTLSSDPIGRVPVIIITAHDSPEAQQRALAGGAAAYLRKPVDAQPLIDAIRAAMSA